MSEPEGPGGAAEPEDPHPGEPQLRQPEIDEEPAAPGPSDADAFPAGPAGSAAPGPSDPGVFPAGLSGLSGPAGPAPSTPPPSTPPPGSPSPESGLSSSSEEPAPDGLPSDPPRPADPGPWSPSAPGHGGPPGPAGFQPGPDAPPAWGAAGPDAPPAWGTPGPDAPPAWGTPGPDAPPPWGTPGPGAPPMGFPGGPAYGGVPAMLPPGMGPPGMLPPGTWYDPASGMTLPQGVQLASVGRRIGAFFLGIALAVVTLGIGWMIWGLIVWGRGQTPALQLLGMRCWRPDAGRVPGWWRMCLRQIVGRFVEGILGIITEAVSLILMCATRRRQSLHDMVGGTTVVYDPGGVLTNPVFYRG